MKKLCYWFVFIWKQYPQNFAFLIQEILEYFPVKFVNVLKSGLIFNIFYCSWMHMPNVCKQIFYISRVCISQKVKGVLMWIFWHIIFIRRQRYWQIFKSALVYLSTSQNNSRQYWRIIFNQISVWIFSCFALLYNILTFPEFLVPDNALVFQRIRCSLKD